MNICNFTGILYEYKFELIWRLVDYQTLVQSFCQVQAAQIKANSDLMLIDSVSRFMTDILQSEINLQLKKVIQVKYCRLSSEYNLSSGQ